MCPSARECRPGEAILRSMIWCRCRHRCIDPAVNRVRGPKEGHCPHLSGWLMQDLVEQMVNSHNLWGLGRMLTCQAVRSDNWLDDG